jgi:hypothetical protein
VKKQISIKTTFQLLVLSLSLTAISLISLQYEFLLPDSHWIYALAILFPTDFVLLLGILKHLSDPSVKNAGKYLVSTLGLLAITFIVIYYFHSVLVIIGKVQPYNNEDSSFEEDLRRFGSSNL